MIEGAVTWTGHGIARFGDGDSVRMRMSHDEVVDHRLKVTVANALPSGLACRIMHADAPEKGEPDYYKFHRLFVEWLVEHEDELMIETYLIDNFGRYICDIYLASDRNETATKHMLMNGCPLWR